MKRKRIVFSGSGGQGVITAAILLAEAAVLFEGLNAVQSQAYGAEARGGATRSDVIISNTDIYFPKVTQPNILVCLTQAAYGKFRSMIRPGGLLLTDSRFVTIEKKVDAHQTQLPMWETVTKEIGEPHRLQYLHARRHGGIDGTGSPRLNRKNHRAAASGQGAGYH